MATRALVLLLFVQLAFTLAARRNNDPLMEGIYQARRTANGMMGGYAGISKRGPPMAIAGGFATHLSPSYAAASDEEQEDEPVMMDEEEMEEEPKLDEESEEKIKPVRPAKRPSRKRPQRPRQDEEEDDEGDMMGGGGGGVSAIATSYSSGKGASSKSHAIAYGGGYKGGRFSH